MKNIHTLLFLIVLIFTLFGCKTTNQPISQVKPAEIELEAQFIEYKSKLISVKFPKNYEVRENGDMLVLSSTTGKIIIGGFLPSVGYPEADKKDFPFRSITYTKDKTEAGAIPTALYYTYGDTKTETELLEILKTVNNLP